VLRNEDKPGVIGDVGTALGRLHVNIANFALGRNDDGAIGVVKVDERAAGDVKDQQVTGELSKIPAVKDVRVIRV